VKPHTQDHTGKKKPNFKSQTRSLTCRWRISEWDFFFSTGSVFRYY